MFYEGELKIKHAQKPETLSTLENYRDIQMAVVNYLNCNYAALPLHFQNTYQHNVDQFMTSLVVKRLIKRITACFQDPNLEIFIAEILKSFIISSSGRYFDRLIGIKTFLVLPLLTCLNCKHLLKWRSKPQDVVLLTLTKAFKVSVCNGSCINSDCNASTYYIDGFNLSGQQFYYDFSMLSSNKMIRINQKYVITFETIQIYIIGNLVNNGVRCWNSQLNYLATAENVSPIPHPKKSPLFTRAFIIFTMVQYNVWSTNKVYRNIVDTSNDCYADLRNAVNIINKWFSLNFARKWIHSCQKCHIQNNCNTMEVSYLVMDGKVMGHQVCRHWNCCNNIVNRRLGFCSVHKEIGQSCFVMACPNNRLIGKKIPISFGCDNAVCQKLISQYFYKSNQEFNVKRPISVNDLLKNKLSHEKAGFRYSLKRKYLPCLFIAVWGCGSIANIRKFYTYETHEDVINFLEDTIEKINHVPTVIVYDKACKILQSLQKAREYVTEIRKVITEHCIWVVDKFHFLKHKETFCANNTNPYKLEYGMEKMKFGTQMNTSAAEGCNSWIAKYFHLLRFLDADIHDFLMYAILDNRNSVINNIGSK